MNIKKLIIIILALSFIISAFTMCGGDDSTDTTPPKSSLIGVNISKEGTVVTIKWSNPTSDSDFDHVTIIRKKDVAPTNTTDGEQVYQGNSDRYVDSTITVDGKYYYGLFACDSSNNCADPVILSIEIAFPTYTTPEKWIAASSDYLTFADAYYATTDGSWGAVNKGIDDLIVYNEKLYMGIGDANYNLGGVYCPMLGKECGKNTDGTYINDAAGHGMPVLSLTKDASAPTIEFVVQDEAISEYRICGDKLVIPGVDATEDALIGNVYIQNGGTWTKHRKLEKNLHIHDIIDYNGTLYACGSGIETVSEYSEGKVAGTVWKSTDNGETWTIDYRYTDKPVGDCRYVGLFAFTNGLYAYGTYNENYQSTHTNVSLFNNGTEWALSSNFLGNFGRTVFCHSFTSGKYFITATDLSKSKTKGYVVTSTGIKTIDAFEDIEFRPLDAFQVGDKDMIIYGIKGQQGSLVLPVNYQIYRTQDLENFELMSDWTITDNHMPYRSVALWNDVLYLGGGDGYLHTASKL